MKTTRMNPFVSTDLIADLTSATDLHPPLVFCLRLGLRSGELAQLRCADIGFDNGTIAVGAGWSGHRQVVAVTDRVRSRAAR